MSGFFNMDGPFYRIGALIADVMILNFYWILFSLPLFTIGASTTALYYVMTRRISDREGYLFRDFWTSFKSNFKQATIIWLIFLAALTILLINIQNINLIGNIKTFVYPVQIFFLLELILCYLYILPIIARFEISLKDSFKTAFFMANRHPLTSVCCIVIGCAVLLASYITIILSLAAMGLYVFLTSYLFIRVFRKYRPEIDQDPILINQIASEDIASDEHSEADGGLNDRSQ